MLSSFSAQSLKSYHGYGHFSDHGVEIALSHRHGDLYMNIDLRRLLHNHGNIATEGSQKPGLCSTLISNDFKGSL